MAGIALLVAIGPVSTKQISALAPGGIVDRGAKVPRFGRLAERCWISRFSFLSVLAIAGLGWYFFARKGRIADLGDGAKIAVTVKRLARLIHVRQGVP